MSQAHAEHLLIQRRMQGWWRHRTWDRQGHIVDPGKWTKNLIVAKVATLLGWLFHGGAQGIQYYALGAGLSAWDANPVAPSVNDATLETEIVNGGGAAISRKVPTIEYLDGSNNIVSGPTNILRLTVIYDYNELNDPGPPATNIWREFGVFGGNASGTVPDSGYMINHVITGSFQKTALLRVERTVTFQF